MRLGLLVSTDRNMRHLEGIAREAVSRGHEVRVFVMDSGVGLLESQEMAALARLEGVEVIYCALAAKASGIGLLPPEIKKGSQYDNSKIIHAADRVISL